MQHEEERIQGAIVTYFRYMHREFAPLLVHVANERRCSVRQGARLKAMGVTAGVADLLLFVPRGGWHGLCLEVKTEKGRQRETQKEWEEAVTAQGYLYLIVRSTDEARKVLETYLKGGFVR